MMTIERRGERLAVLATDSTGTSLLVVHEDLYEEGKSVEEYGFENVYQIDDDDEVSW